MSNGTYHGDRARESIRQLENRVRELEAQVPLRDERIKLLFLIVSLVDGTNRTIMYTYRCWKGHGYHLDSQWAKLPEIACPHCGSLAALVQVGTLDNPVLWEKG